MFAYILLGLASVMSIMLWRKLYPKPYPGIPFVEASGQRIIGDVPDLVKAMQESDEATNSMFLVSTQKLHVPMAQVLPPGLRKPLITLDDPFEIEDIIVRRQGEFDKAATAVEIFLPMFPHGSLSQYTTSDLRAQKRLWSDIMRPEFLRKAAAPNIFNASLELLELWRLRITLYGDGPFNVIEDLKNATLDAIWVALFGTKLGTTKLEIEKLQTGDGNNSVENSTCSKPIVKSEIEYVESAIARNAKTIFPTWSQRLETYTPRYRSFRQRIVTEITDITKDAVDRFSRLDLSTLDLDGHDTCMMDLVLRRYILEATKQGKEPSNPLNDPRILDELFVMLVGGHDSTANALSWFLKFMESYPKVQEELRQALNSSFSDVTRVSVEQILDTDIPYLDAVCEESLRLSGTSKGNLRQATVDTEILGCKVPKGAEVLLNLHINHDLYPVNESKRSPSSRAIMAKHAQSVDNGAMSGLGVFEPKRWLSKSLESGKEVFNPYALPSLAFGGGFRGCFGRKLAMMEFRIMVALLIMTFEFLELPDELKSMKASEAIFRQPQKPHVRLRNIK